MIGTAINNYHPRVLLVLFAAAVLATGLVALVGAKPAWAAERTFEPAPDSPFSVGSTPTTVTNADFNGDGNMDLAAQNSGSNSVSVLLGNGDGTFDPKTDFTVGSGPSAVTSADFDGDNKTDLAIANWSSNSVSVLLGNGDGTFDPKTDFTVGSNPSSVISADFNGDSYADLAVANYASSKVSILLGEDLNGDNKADGTFKARQDFSIDLPCGGVCIPATAGPNQVITADFNGDTKLDLATANLGFCGFFCTPGGVSVLLGNGTGTFQDAKLAKSNTTITSIATNGSGLVATEYDNHRVSLLTNNGNGTFSTGQSFPVRSNPSAVTSADLNGDSKADLAVSNFTSDNVSALWGSGGSFQAAQNFAAGDGPIFVIGADFNADSFADLAVANQNSNNVSVLLSTEDTTLPSAPIITSPSNNSYDTDGNFTVSGTAEANSTVELFDGTTSKGTTTASSSGNWSKTLTGVSEGSHTYTAKATDAAGNTSNASTAVTVTVDKTVPTVSSVTPLAGAIGAAVSASITATFSEDMDAATLTEPNNPTFTLKAPDGSSVTAAVSYDAATKRATLDPGSNLASNTTYTATIKGGSTGVKDLAGNAIEQDYSWTFTTVNVPPTVVSYTPTETTGVPSNTQPTATFSTDMDETTITDTNIKFQVYNKKKKKWIGVAHTVSYDADSRTVKVTPDSTLAASKKYRVTVTTNVKSSTGVALDQDGTTSGNQPKTWIFTTGST